MGISKHIPRRKGLWQSKRVHGSSQGHQQYVGACLFSPGACSVVGHNCAGARPLRWRRRPAGAGRESVTSRTLAPCWCTAALARQRVREEQAPVASRRHLPFRVGLEADGAYLYHTFCDGSVPGSEAEMQ